MGGRIVTFGVLVVAVLGLAALAGAQQGAPRIEPKADEHLKAMSRYLAGLKAFTFQAEEAFDDVQEDGLKIQLGNQRVVSVRQPNRVAGAAEGDTSNSRFFYNGR